MRLLDTSTLTLHEFVGGVIPDYAILSHRWEGEEVSFQDLQQGRAPSMKGFSKIMGCCRQALSDGWKYAWVDSCCIDKTSSAELSEAINSMFKWYQDCKACYVYLSDVPTGLPSHQSVHRSLKSSKWFTRDWTLQELLAPVNVIFYDCNWGEIGTKRSMGPLLSSITGIDRFHLFDFEAASVAQKMSWASKRNVTRLEDLAYSLLGIFHVHMPPLYGEGLNAFLRLQQEILESTDDESLFAWQPMANAPITGLFAPNPAAFRNSGDIIVSKIDKSRPPFVMTNKGLRVEVFLLPSLQKSQYLKFSVPLNCSRRKGENISLLLFQRGVDNAESENTEYIRYGPMGFGEIPELTQDPTQPHDAPSIQELALKKYNVKRRTVIFVKQSGNSDQRNNFYYDLPISFAINTTSLLQHGITTFEETTAGSEFQTFKTRELTNFGEFARSELVELGQGDWVSNLRFAPSTLDTFILVVYTHWKTPSVKILTAEEDNPADEQSKISYNDWEWVYHSDRVSKVLRSGKSVSVALRNKFETEGPYFVLDITIDPEGPYFVLDITIDPEGKMLWPAS